MWWSFKTAGDGDSSNSLGSQFHCLTTLSMKKLSSCQQFGLLWPKCRTQHLLKLSPLISAHQSSLSKSLCRVTALQWINTPTQLGVVYKLRVPLVPLFTLSVRIPSRAVPNTGAHPKCNSIHHLSRPSKPERFLPSKVCTHPSHKQPVSPEEHLSVLLNGIGYFCFEKTRDLQTRIRSKI